MVIRHKPLIQSELDSQILQIYNFLRMRRWTDIHSRSVATISLKYSTQEESARRRRVPFFLTEP